MSIVSQFDWELEQLDVKTTFLHGDLEEKKNLMTHPEGFEEPEKEHLVCLLKKSLYGLKQSPRQCYKRFDTFILKIGFKISSYDGCFYYKKLQGSLMMFFLIYVTDMLLACKDKPQIQEVKRILKLEFDMMDLGNARRILDMEIVRNREDRTLFLSQKGYLEKVFHGVDNKSKKFP